MLGSQYGVATPSSATPVSHAEDTQPNETIYKRRHGHPPQIGGSSWKNNYRDSGNQRGGYKGPWTQYGIRGNSWRGRGNSWRGRGDFHSNRGGHHNSNQRHPDQVQRPPHHSVPPIATLPDIEYHLSSSSSSSSSLSSQIKATQSSMPDSPPLQENRLPQVEPFSMPTSSESQLVDDHYWLHRSRSPSPKLLQSPLKRKEIEHQPIYASNSGQNEDLVISQSIEHHLITEPIPPKANKALLPGYHRRSEGSAPIPALRSVEPPLSPIVPKILVETSSIKQELLTPSPTRSLRMERSLITSSCKFYPIPALCKKSHPGFKENRKAFFNEKMQELKRLGLTKIKSFFRDDGLAIEWKSKVPVWSDTLLPEYPDLASAIKEAYQMNHHASMKSNSKRKRQSVDQHSREFSLKNNDHTNVEPNESKRPRHSHEDTRIQDGASEIEIVESSTMPLMNSSFPKPMSSLALGNRPSTTVVPFLNTSELICLDPEDVPHNQYDAILGDAVPLHTVIQHPEMSAMDVDMPTTTQRSKPMRRMLFKPVLPPRTNQLTISSVQDSTLLTSNSAKPLSTNLPVPEEFSKRNENQVNSQSALIPVQEKTTPRRPRPPLPSPRSWHSSYGPSQSHPLPIPQPLLAATQDSSTPRVSKSCTPTPPSLLLLQPSHDTQIVEDVEVQEMRASPSMDGDYGITIDLDAELVVNLLLHGTPEESHKCLSNSCQEDLQLHTADHEADKDKDDEPLVSPEEDTTAIEILAIQFLQQYLQLFDVDRLKLETAYAKNALFSCRVHHVQEPSFSMAGLFVPESSGSRQGFDVSRSRGSISAIQKGRGQIVNRLLQLGPHRFCPRGVPRTVKYDVVLLPTASGGGILLTVHGEVVNPHLAGPQMDHVLSVDQSFVLRRREDEDEGVDGFGQTISSATVSNLWPLIVVSHQMTVRDAVPLLLEQLDGLASRIQGS